MKKIFYVCLLFVFISCAVDRKEAYSYGDYCFKYIDDNIQKPISLEEASEYAHINKSYLSQLFKQKNFPNPMFTYNVKCKAVPFFSKFYCFFVDS